MYKYRHYYKRALIAPPPTFPMKGHLAISLQVFSDIHVQSTVGITKRTLGTQAWLWETGLWV